MLNLVELQQVVHDSDELFLVAVADKSLDCIENSEVSVGRVLAEAVEHQAHLAALEVILAHDLQKFLKTVLKEIDLSLVRVFV